MVNRHFRSGDWTYDYYGTWMDINDDPAAKSITLFGAGQPLVFTDGNSGLVGIGTNTPMYKLDVAGSINIAGQYYLNGIPLISGSGTTSVNYYQPNGNLGLAFNATSATLYNYQGNQLLQGIADRTLLFDEAGNEILSIKTGNVGIGTATPTASLSVNGSISTGLTLVGDADYTALVTDNVISYNSALSTHHSVLLPAISTVGNGFHYTIKSDNAVNGSNILEVTANGGDTIDGSATYDITTAYGSISIVSDATDGHWIITSQIN
jgi:hypothetical protein